MGDLIDVPWAALDAAASLADVRLSKLLAETEVRECAAELERVRLRVESELLASVGGEKGLGPNAEAQKRALALYVAQSRQMTNAALQLESAKAEVGSLGVRESYLSDVYRVFLASIPSGLTLSKENLDKIIYPFAARRAAEEAEESPQSNCENGDCAGKYGDPAAWCPACREAEETKGDCEGCISARNYGDPAGTSGTSQWSSGSSDD